MICHQSINENQQKIMETFHRELLTAWPHCCNFWGDTCKDLQSYDMRLEASKLQENALFPRNVWQGLLTLGWTLRRTGVGFCGRLQKLDFRFLQSDCQLQSYTIATYKFFHCSFSVHMELALMLHCVRWQTSADRNG